MSGRLSDDDLKSLREWIAHWGDGPNWVDARGEMIPATKTTMTQLVDECERLRAVIRQARTKVLHHGPHRVDRLFKANLGALLDNALDDNRDGFFDDGAKP